MLLLTVRFREIESVGQEITDRKAKKKAHLKHQSTDSSIDRDGSIHVHPGPRLHQAVSYSAQKQAWPCISCTYPIDPISSYSRRLTSYLPPTRRRAPITPRLALPKNPLQQLLHKQLPPRRPHTPPHPIPRPPPQPIPRIARHLSPLPIIPLPQPPLPPIHNAHAPRPLPARLHPDVLVPFLPLAIRPPPRPRPRRRARRVRGVQRVPHAQRVVQGEADGGGHGVARGAREGCDLAEGAGEEGRGPGGEGGAGGEAGRRGGVELAAGEFVLVGDVFLRSVSLEGVWER